MLGPSGSGKTTCLMMLAGFEPATSGEIYLSGKPINRTPPHKRGIGLVFQNYALFPHMTVLENVAFGLRMRGEGKSAREEKARSDAAVRADALADQVDVGADQAADVRDLVHERDARREQR